MKIELYDAGPNKIQAIKTIRKHTGFGLIEAKGLADSAPTTFDVESGAEALVTELTGSGAKAWIVDGDESLQCLVEYAHGRIPVCYRDAKPAVIIAALQKADREMIAKHGRDGLLIAEQLEEIHRLRAALKALVP